MSEREGHTMPDGEHPIDIYITQLARRLHLPAAERDQVLAEVRGHLEERAGALHETGVSEEHAERQAVQAFGPVGRISQELRAAHPIAWGTRRWLVGMLTGAVVIYALYLVESVPLLIYQFQPPYNGPPLDPMGDLECVDWLHGRLFLEQVATRSGSRVPATRTRWASSGCSYPSSFSTPCSRFCGDAVRSTGGCRDWPTVWAPVSWSSSNSSM